MIYNKLVVEILARLSKGKTPQKIADLHSTTLSNIKKQIDKGEKVEKEHGGTAKTARAVALDHLVEDPKYYTKLKKAKL